MTLPLKCSIFALTLSSFGAIGYGVFAYSQQGTTISKLIEDKYEYVLLSTVRGENNKDKSIWTTNWKNYKTESEKLKEKCEELAREIVYGEGKELYAKVTKYCGRGITFEEQATKDGILILDTKTPSKDSDVWSTKYKNKNQIMSDLNLLSIENETSTADKIRLGCEKAKSNNKQIKNYRDIYEAFKKVCAH